MFLFLLIFSIAFLFSFPWKRSMWSNDAKTMAGIQQCAILSPTILDRLEVKLIPMSDMRACQLILSVFQTLGGNEAKRLLMFLLPVILLSVGINFPRFFEVVHFLFMPRGFDLFDRMSFLQNSILFLFPSLSFSCPQNLIYLIECKIADLPL